ncbi:unnamed protein product [Cylindrotheca closterium]|uniref:Exostosin GT47 domain-containing protein n=1 Tax=Cylindrotheca closterium TaxID=2856 RepID=A0AAD2JL84_9STRA|nr:unnamed protein product [Cylindrotheca closterium]
MAPFRKAKESNSCKSRGPNGRQRTFNLCCYIVACLTLVIGIKFFQPQTSLWVDFDSESSSASSIRHEQTKPKSKSCSEEKERSPSTSPELLLSVPFYVYEDQAWINATIQDKLVSDMAKQHTKYGSRFKHGDDYWLLEASLKHPMRTQNKSEAKLFFVPWLLNFFDFRSFKDVPLCWNGKCNMELLLDAVAALKESETFKLYPDRHIVVRSFYSAHWESWNQELERGNKEGYKQFLYVFKKMQVITFEGKDLYPNPGHRIVLPSYYVGTPCKLSNEKPFDVAMVASLSPEKPRFQHRRNLCHWLKNGQNHENKTTLDLKISSCGHAEQCPALAESKFGFHVAGDTFSSNRLMDTILSGSVPIFTHLNQYTMAGGEWIDWNQLSYYIPIHNDTNLKSSPEDAGKLRPRKGANQNIATHPTSRYSMLPPASESTVLERMDAIVHDEKGYEERYHKILQHIPLFEYTTLHPFDTYMYLFQAELYPETRHRPEVYNCRWSALKLPRPFFDG